MERGLSVMGDCQCSYTGTDVQTHVNVLYVLRNFFFSPKNFAVRKKKDN